MKRTTGEYGTYDEKRRAWRGESEDEFYGYAIMDARILSFTPGDNVWMFAKSLKAAMETAADMLLEGIYEIEIGVPSGHTIQIDARYVDLRISECPECGGSGWTWVPNGDDGDVSKEKCHVCKGG